VLQAATKKIKQLVVSKVRNLIVYLPSTAHRIFMLFKMVVLYVESAELTDAKESTSQHDKTKD
jgi:hypothetical protein